MIFVAVCLSEIGSGEGVWLCVVMLKSRESLAEDMGLICLFMVVSTEETRFTTEDSNSTQVLSLLL